MNKLAAELDIHKAIDSIRFFILELLACEGVTLFLVDSENKSVRQARNSIVRMHSSGTLPVKYIGINLEMSFTGPELIKV